MSEDRAVRIRLTGRVQGVGFRRFVRRAAQDLGLTGQVRNLPDGRVEIEAAGAPDRLDALRERLRQGPPGARVTHLEEEDLSPMPAWEGFVIDH